MKPRVEKTTTAKSTFSKLSVEFEGVTKRFASVTAVDDLSLSIPEGSIYGFIGPNGSGKTTTMRMIAGIFLPDRGKICVLGNEFFSGWRGLIGYLPEERGIYKKMTARALLLFHAELRGVQNAATHVNSWLERFSLSDFGSNSVETLSKGVTQKVQFVAAAMGTAEQLCERILMIFHGRKVLDGTLVEIQDRYGNDTIRISAHNSAACLAGLRGVEQIRDFGQVQEIRLARNSDPQALLQTLMARTSVSSFSIAKPSLQDIFIRIAGHDAGAEQEEVPNAKNAIGRQARLSGLGTNEGFLGQSTAGASIVRRKLLCGRYAERAAEQANKAHCTAR